MTETKEAKKRISITIIVGIEKRRALRQLALDRNSTVQELVSAWIDEGLNKAEVKAVEVKQQEQEKKPRTTRTSKPRKARATRKKKEES